MKIQVTKTSTEELDLQFPISFKHKTGNVFYHCIDEKNSIGVYGDRDVSFHITHAVLNHYSPEQNCEKSEVEAAFNKAIENMKSIFYEKDI